MTEPSPLDKAEAAAREAETNTVAVQLALAAVELAKAATTQQAPACQHQHKAKPTFDAKKWWTIGGLAIVGGCVACALALAFALASVAVAIGATCATACLIVLRSMWRDFANGR
ncbi:hypothetical protein [Streptomyces hokutonensis]|uniref:hypothetical protein n=1 Tax=Streptomyces hokutonensis TaxID=1306990 RepID=UPI0003A5915B|nr:hypothetical protein [Streptomyces hokutonensis]